LDPKRRHAAWFGAAVLALTASVSGPACGADAGAARGAGTARDAGAAVLKEAAVVTEVLEWGETVTALRLEYSDDIDCRAIEYSNEQPGKMTYHLVNDRSITNIYVNDSGRKDDVQLHGRYVFINLGTKNQDYTTYRDQVTFNTTSKYRDRVSAFYGFQSEPIVTRSGQVIAPNRFVTTREIAVGLDDFRTFTYRNPQTGHVLYYHLYIPKGYEAGTHNAHRLPLVVHYPSGDYSYTDYAGKYRGALFTHPDALYWTSDTAQATHPAFVVTVGGTADPGWNHDFADSEMQQNYLSIVNQILTDYAVDSSRIYAISLAGGSVPMWNTILANPKLFAAQISTSYDPYHAWKDVKLGEDRFAALLKAAPGWFFAGFTDGSGAGSLGPGDTRVKGERLRDVAELMNARGMNVDVGYGREGELMWNGLLRGEAAERMAQAQVARAKTRGARHLVTLYIPGTLPQTMHWSWNATYSNAVVRDWMFQQVNPAIRAGAAQR
jgi:predicted peptidase